ncbi:MAG TPA: DegT/DnrJ/EryC1/StrS family aminotransferase [Allosphingosinicella sp.]|nr:DegT/DnrJ/EryC1/StrS family aminotransferase [Allosphingosinicella sp.]
MSNPPIYVTKPYLPPLEALLPMLQQIWDTRILSNSGPFHQALERRLEAFLSVPHVSLANNGMIALEIAIEAAGLRGEVITTPYSFVATTHAVKRGQLEPVFVDIWPDDLNIDPGLIEDAITPRTSAIVAVHCYGNPCAVEEIEEIARRRGLTVIYDAAHAFGVTHRGRGLLSWGDYATLSFHATKAFNTFEGGAIVASADPAREAVERQRNFGIRDEVTIETIGTNAKMSEFNAAVGLLQLDHFEHVRSARAAVDGRYREALAQIGGLAPLPLPAETQPNHSYFPLLVGPEFPLSRDALQQALLAAGIHSRRYFYPLLSSLPMYSNAPSAAADRLPVATRAADQILCLPIYPDLSEADQQRIMDAVCRAARG